MPLHAEACCNAFVNQQNVTLPVLFKQNEDIVCRSRQKVQPAADTSHITAWASTCHYCDYCVGVWSFCHNQADARAILEVHFPRAPLHKLSVGGN